MVLIVLAVLFVVGLLALVLFFALRYRAARDETQRIRAMTQHGMTSNYAAQPGAGVRTYDDLPDDPNKPRSTTAGHHELVTQLPGQYDRTPSLLSLIHI